jgi:hypothetical protein
MGPLPQDMVQSDFHHLSDVQYLESVHIRVLSSTSAADLREHILRDVRCD